MGAHMKLKHILAGVAMAALLPLSANASSNLLTNGSFETGDFTGWTQSGNGGYTSVEPSGYGYSAEDGNYFVFEGPVGSDGLLSQTFSDTAGQTLQISGWVTGDGSSPSDVNFIFDGTTYISINPVPEQGWTEYSFDVTATGSDTFSVGFRNDPAFDGLDNFSVTAVPEISTWLMMLAGFAGLGFVGYRQGRRERDIQAV